MGSGGPGDPEWERRQAVLEGRVHKPDAGDEGASFTGDGPAGENVSDGPEIAGDDGDEKDADEDDD